MKLKSIMAVALLAGASSAMAGDFYIAGAVGRSYANIDQTSIDTTLASFGATAINSNKDETDTGYKLQAGWQFHKNFALEGGYVDLGKVRYGATYTGGTTDLEYETDGWNIGVVGTMPINDMFSVFGRVGAIAARVEQTCATSGTPIACTIANNNSTDWSGNFGLGATYNINKQVGLRLEWERFDNLGDNNIGGKSDVDLLSLGVVVKF